jgi:putative transposase
MPKGLRRFHHTGDWHFITCSCYQRRKFFEIVRRRDLFLEILEQVRAKYDFVAAAYVVPGSPANPILVCWGGVMPEHIHLLIGEPRVKKLSRAMQVLKQRVSLRCRAKKRKNAKQMRMWDDTLPPVFTPESQKRAFRGPRAFWQPRYYDFNVFTRRKYLEKLRYIHRNPVKRGLVSSPELWRWSSYRDYALGEPGRVKIGN